MPPAPPPGCTADRPAPGLTVWQPARSYRFGVEVYLLARFALDALEEIGAATGRTALSVTDLGCGSGIVGMLLALKGHTVTGVERDDRWLPLLAASVAASPALGGRYRFVHADVRDPGGWPDSTDPADLAVSNPPWFPPDQPRSPDPWRANARSMLHGATPDFIAAGLRIAPALCLLTRPDQLPAAVSGAHTARRARHGPLVLADLRRDDTRRGSGAGEITLDVQRAYDTFLIPHRGIECR